MKSKVTMEDETTKEEYNKSIHEIRADTKSETNQTDVDISDKIQ